MTLAASVLPTASNAVARVGFSASASSRVGHHAGQREGHQHVEHGDDGEAEEDAAGQGLLRVLDLLGARWPRRRSR